jgi:hypothetical protein
MKQAHPLKDLYLNHSGYTSDKWERYLFEYDRLLNDKSSTPIRLLEVGIQNGGSLQIWADYFTKAQHIVGCDVNRQCENLQYTNNNISVVIGNATETETKNRLTSITPKFDLIIDDGSHTSGDIIKTFFNLFPILDYSGIYIIEDLHCSYWHAFEGGLFKSTSSINFLKTLVDLINHEHWGLNLNRQQLIEHYGVPVEPNIEDLLAEIHSIEFINSLCIITRRPQRENLLGSRHVAGAVELVAKNLHMNGTYSTTQPQNNPCFLPHEDTEQSDAALSMRISELEQELSALKSKIKNLKT